MFNAFSRALLGACALAAPLLSVAEPRGLTARQALLLERALSPGLAVVSASPAIRDGRAGQGVVVAMIDAGPTPAGALFVHRSPASVDLVEERRFGDLGAEHGRQTATLLAAARDGMGTMGIAYGATLLSIRADIDGSCRTTCAMTGREVAQGIDYAIAHGARVIGLPVAANRPLPSIEAALTRAVRSGALIVAAAGNDGHAEPVWPARYANDPRYRGAIIVAGAGTARRAIAQWSNRAGSTANYFLVAPGERLPVDCDTRTCSIVSGSSYSVSYIAGAAALLIGRHPERSAHEIAGLLLDSARADRASRSIAGRGALDVARAVKAAEKLQGVS